MVESTFSRAQCGPIGLFFGQNCPGNSGKFVSQGNNTSAPLFSKFQSVEPGSETMSVALGARKDSSRAVNQELSQIRITPFANSEKAWFPACRELLRNEAKPSRQVTTLSECCSISNSGHESCCRDCADAGYRLQTLTRLGFCCYPGHCFVGSANSLFEFFPF